MVIKHFYLNICSLMDYRNMWTLWDVYKRQTFRHHTKDCVNLLQGIHLLILYDLLLTVLDPVKQIAVSYTHLDVYKRQVWILMSYRFAFQELPCTDHCPLRLLKSLPYHMVYCNGHHCICPVSYTHLDVYKRQPATFMCWMILPIFWQTPRKTVCKSSCMIWPHTVMWLL